MIFEALQESNKAGELILIEGGYCRWHLRKDNVIIIYEIISQVPGAGQEMLRRLLQVPGALVIQAKCPVEFVSNEWYRKRGFECTSQQTTPSGKLLNVWRLQLCGLPL